MPNKLEFFKSPSNFTTMGLDERLLKFKAELSSSSPILRMKAGVKPVIGYDLDGVFYDFIHSLRHYIYMETGRAMDTMPDTTRWEIWEEWGMELDEWLGYCNRGADAGYIFTTKGSWSPHTVKNVDVVKSLKKILNAEIVVITDRWFGSSPEVSKEATVEWLNAHQFPYDQLIFSPDKTVYKTDFFIDDRPSNCEALNAIEGTNVIMMDKPWNKGHNTDIPRTKSIIDFNTFILEKYFQAGASIEETWRFDV